MILQRTQDVYAGFYDFKTTGGAIGSYNLNVPIPKNSVITEFVAITKDACTSAGNLAQISFDIIRTDVSPNTVAIGGFMSAIVIAGLNFGTPNFGRTGNPVLSPSSSYGCFANTFSVGMSISVEPLLSGSIKFYARCISFDL